MSSTGKSLAIAVIGAFATLGAAWLTSSNVSRSTTERTIEESKADLKTLQAQVSVASDGAARAYQMAASLMQGCTYLTADTLTRAVTRTKTTTGQQPATVEVISYNGPGCLASGAILGYYYQRFQGGTNYSVQIEVDGRSYHFPDADEPIAYLRNNAAQNGGVLPLPAIAFKQSLRITYYYPGNGTVVNAYAVVVPQENAIR